MLFGVALSASALAQPTNPGSDWRVELITLRVANKPISADQLDDRNLPQLYSTTQLYVPRIEEPLTIEFGAPYAPSAQKLQYRYKLAGFDKDWIYTDADYRRATYTNLDFGNYNFMVEASPNGNYWFGTRSIALEVAAPLWLSPWAIAFYAVLIISMLVAVGAIISARRQAIHLLRDSEERLKLSLWGSGDQLWDWHIDSDELHRHNTWRQLKTFPEDGIRFGDEAGKSNIHPADLHKVQRALRHYLEGKTDHYEQTYRVASGKGWMWVLDRGKIVTYDEQQQPKRMTGTLKDITPLVTAEERLKMLAASITNISDGVCIYDAQFKVVETNQSFSKITGYRRDDVIGRPLQFALYSPDYLEQIKQIVQQHGSWHGELEDLRKDGTVYQIELTFDAIRDENKEISYYVATFSDITDRKNAERELRRLSNTDTLTGLPNRSYFQVSHSNLVRKRIMHALLLFDLDDFKKINDSLGHEVGDHLLMHVAERVAEVGRAQDTFYRLGGDEFVLMLEDTTDVRVITSAAKRILESLSQPFHISGHDIVVSSSIGIVVYPSDGQSSQELLQNADTAMYHAKNRGGATYQFFNESMNKNAVRRLQVENQLRHALRNNYLQVHYQPKVSLRTNKFVGLEALVRLEIPDVGIVSPAEFIPMAEETGLIIEVGERVLRQTCRDMREWVEAGAVDGRVAVNLSAKQFLQPDLAKQITTILKEEKLNPTYLELEITEGVVMDDPERAIEIMTELNKLGIHLALDDFGTGYSSLAYLKRFPIQTLKIDKAFIDDINGAERDRNMVASIVAMAHNLGLDVVAEGVVDLEQANTLSNLKCEFAQGYLFAQPLRRDQFLEHISTTLATLKKTV
ncbi:hypothetical protein CWI71_08225 [Pseudidiomarina insulisalsae]|uniref:GGDEF domain-containing protein n=2 Tax=Pseudidiomarina insulisalsae TaxID=575789 RepID=A0A432YEM6_9GAMM|nr:hypothetical protein CWI71_08225 [Pseudidiomarina insulisalsae]